MSLEIQRDILMPEGERVLLSGRTHPRCVDHRGNHRSDNKGLGLRNFLEAASWMPRYIRKRR